MKPATENEFDCSIGHCLNLIGDRWTLLILRNAFHGMRTFDAFKNDLGLSTSVLSDRLQKLTRSQIFDRSSSTADGRSIEYRLTERGLDLYPVFIALMQWGEKWQPNALGPRVILKEKSTGEEIYGAAVLGNTGAILSAKEVEPSIGPGASEKIKKLINHRHDSDRATRKAQSAPAILKSKSRMSPNKTTP